jgi:molybdate transport system regulatory protein
MIEVECRISIKKDGVSFLDPVKTELLNEIKRSGSLNAAAKKLQISYQNAWTKINEMNNSAPELLVTKQRGGAHGGGAVITAYGEKILKDYYAIQAQVNKMVNQVNVEINL